MLKRKNKLITISCKKCLSIFIEKIEVLCTNEEGEKMEIDINCHECGTLLTVEIEGDVSLDRMSLRQFKGLPKIG